MKRIVIAGILALFVMSSVAEACCGKRLGCGGMFYHFRQKVSQTCSPCQVKYSTRGSGLIKRWMARVRVSVVVETPQTVCQGPVTCQTQPQVVYSTPQVVLPFPTATPQVPPKSTPQVEKHKTQDKSKHHQPAPLVPRKQN